MRKIPFVHTLAASEESAWIAAIEAAAPDVAICPAPRLTQAERETAPVAIVANPEPSDLRHLPALRWVQSLWAGVERLVPHTPADVAIVRMTDPHLAETMAEAVLAWTLYLHRDMPRYARQQRQRLWRQHDALRAQDRSVGILGLGKMGQAAARQLIANGFRVLGWSRSPKQIPDFETFFGDAGLGEVLARSDILVVLLPLTERTKGLIGAAAVSGMKNGASLINFGRGAIVDTDALLAKLEDRSLDHAVLDVFAIEPLPVDSPLWAHEHVSVLPHISAPTNVATASRIAAENLKSFFRDGSIPASVDRQKGY